MPRALWPLLNDRPSIQVILTRAQGGQQVVRSLLADTGAGAANSGFELLLDEQDCLLCGGRPAQGISLGGAYTGSFSCYRLRVRVPLLGFDRRVTVVGVSTVPPDFDGIACFQFLNRFTYGTCADPGHFGLEI